MGWMKDLAIAKEEAQVKAHEQVHELQRRQRATEAAQALAAGADALMCAGCGQSTHCPWRLVREANPGPDRDFCAVAGVTGMWVAVPVCAECHFGPNTLKGHFCRPEQAEHFCRRAGGSNIGGR